MLSGTLEAILLGTVLTGKGICRVGYGNKEGKWILRAGYGNKKSNSTLSFNKFCTRFIDSMLSVKNVIDYTSFFCLMISKKKW